MMMCLSRAGSANPSVSRRKVACILVAAAVFSVSHASTAQIVVNEVYYDHPGADTGWEFVELMNTGDESFDLSPVSLECVDGRSGGARTVWSSPEGLILPPGAYLLVSGSERGHDPDLILTGALENGPDAILLVSGASIMDCIGYGPLTCAGCFEMEPAPDVDAGMSLSRKPDGNDTDRNSIDLVISEPTPGMPNFFLRDLGIVLGDDITMPCRGGYLSLVINVADAGLERHPGPASLKAAVYAGGDADPFDMFNGTCCVSSGFPGSITVELAVPPGDMIEFVATLETAGDENRANDEISADFRTSPSDIVITEIMYRPAKGASEWIELFNTSTRQCDIGAWTVCDAAGTKRPIAEEDLLIGPGDYLILAQDPGRFAENAPACSAPVCGVSGGWPYLNDRSSGTFADRVELRDDRDIIVEQVLYDDLIGDERGCSIERFSTRACSGFDGGIWHRCGDPAGSTPGRETSIGGDGFRPAGDISISPNPFCPDRDGRVVISGARSGMETGFLVRIFDIGGFEVRRLYGEDGGAQPFACYWEGMDGRGALVENGLYIVVVEFAGSGGGVCRREKGCLAVHAGRGVFKGAP